MPRPSASSPAACCDRRLTLPEPGIASAEARSPLIAAELLSWIRIEQIRHRWSSVQAGLSSRSRADAQFMTSVLARRGGIEEAPSARQAVNVMEVRIVRHDRVGHRWLAECRPSA